MRISFSWMFSTFSFVLNDCIEGANSFPSWVYSMCWLRETKMCKRISLSKRNIFSSLIILERHCHVIFHVLCCIVIWNLYIPCIPQHIAQQFPNLETLIAADNNITEWKEVVSRIKSFLLQKSGTIWNFWLWEYWIYTSFKHQEFWYILICKKRNAQCLWKFLVLKTLRWIWPTIGSCVIVMWFWIFFFLFSCW